MRKDNSYFFKVKHILKLLIHDIRIVHLFICEVLIKKNNKNKNA